MRITPRHLNTQLILLVSCILLVTGAISGWVRARQQSNMLIATMLENSTVMTENFSDNAAHHLVVQDYAGLESFLLKAAELPDIVRLQVCEPDGAVVGDVEHGPGNKPRVLPGMKRIAPPSRPPSPVIKSNTLIIWEPIEAGTRLGWIKATYSLDAIHDAQARTWRNSLLLALFWVACSGVLLFLVLRPLAQSINRLATFARHLDEHKGDQLAAAHQTIEIEELGASLNYASSRLFSTEQQLINERERLRVTLRSIHDGVIAADKAGTIVFMNGSGEDLTGWSVADATGRKIDEIFRLQLSRPGKPAVSLLSAVIDGAAVEELDPDAVLIAKNGRERFIAGSAAPMQDDGGNLSGMVIVFRDITEHKQAEQRLALLNFALNNVRDEAYLINEQARFDYVNDQTCSALGYCRDEMLGMNVSDIDPNFPPERWHDHWREIRQHGSLTFEGSHRSRAGRIYPVEVSANYFEYDGRGYNLALARDITERKHAEEALRKSNELLERVFSASQTMIAYLDRDFTFIRVNQAYAAADDRTPDYFHGKNHFALYPNAENEQIFRTVVSTGTPYTAQEKAFEYSGHPERGMTYWDWTLQPVKEAGGTVSGLVMIMQNVTARRQASLEREKLEQQLRQAQKMESIGTLAGGVAHDFNNILTAIIGYSNIIKMKMKPDDPLRSAVDQVLLSSDRAAHLTQGLLAFGRKQVINPRPVDLNDVIRNLEKLLRRLIGEDIDLSTRFAGANLIAMADAGQIEQVLMNLAANARDAMPEGGALTISTDEIELGADFITAHGYGRPGRYALIAVSDTGEGMDEATREKIFEPFFTTKELGKGTGLGLAIVYGIVKQHGGAINVYSEPGKGTVFKIYLPLAASAIEEARPEAAAQPRGGTETILLAEDDDAVRTLIRNVLTDFGYRVIEALDGQDALEKFTASAQDIDLLITDVIMPHKSGKEFYDAAKAVRPDLNALLISGYTGDFLSKKGIFAEGIEFLSKPVSPFALLQKIRGMLDKRQGSRTV